MRRRLLIATGSTGVACEVSTSTVSSSTFFAPVTFGSVVLCAESGCSARVTLNTTSSAVKGEPSWNFTFGRSLNRHPAPLASGVQESASRGSILKFSSRPTSGSVTLLRTRVFYGGAGEVGAILPGTDCGGRAQGLPWPP